MIPIRHPSGKWLHVPLPGSGWARAFLHRADGAFTTTLAVAVQQLTGSSLMMGLFLLAQIIPELIFTLLYLGKSRLIGSPHRLVLLCADSGRMLTVLSIAALTWLQLFQIWHLLVLAVLFSLCRSFFHPAYSAITPNLVVKDHIASAFDVPGTFRRGGSVDVKDYKSPFWLGDCIKQDKRPQEQEDPLWHDWFYVYPTYRELQRLDYGECVRRAVEVERLPADVKILSAEQFTRHVLASL